MKNILSSIRRSLLLVVTLPLAACITAPADEAVDQEDVGESADALSNTGEAPISGQSSQDSPALANNGGTVFMVHRGQSSNTLYLSSFSGAGWTTNVSISGQSSKAAVGLATYQGKLHMAHLSSSTNDILFTSLTSLPNTWSTNYSLAYQSTKTPAMSFDPQGNQLVLVYVEAGTNRLAYAVNRNADNQNLAFNSAGWQNRGYIGPTTNKVPALAVMGNVVHMVFEQSNGTMAHTSFNGTSWATPQAFSFTLTEQSSPALTSVNNTLFLFHRSPTNDTLRFVQSTDGVNWTADTGVGSSQSSDSPAVSWIADPSAQGGRAIVLAHIGNSTKNLYYLTPRP